MNTFLVFNQSQLYKRTLSYLNATGDEPMSPNKFTLNLSQIGMAYNISPESFSGHRFDNELLNFMAKYRNSISFTLVKEPVSINIKFIKNKSILDDNNVLLYLLRITITNLHKDERDIISNFMADNFERYTSFIKQTVSYEKNIDEERVIDLNQLSDPDFIKNRKLYKDLTLVFGL